MADYDLGTARGKIELDASTLGRTSAAFTTLGKGLLGIGAVALAGFGVAVGAAANFEQQLSRFGAVTGATEQQLEAIRQKALQLGRDSAYGASEVVQAFVELGKAGATSKEILNGVGDAVVHLAAAGELNMTRAAEVMINAMRTFNLGAADAEHVADLLAGAANASTSEVDDLAESLRYAGPVAAVAGISIDDLATVLAVFANVGIKGSQAGTTLRGMLVAITAPTGAAAQKMKDLKLITADGANVFFDATGKIKPMGEVFDILKKSMSNLTKEQQLSALKTIFQRRAMVGAARAAISGKEGFDAMGEAMDRVTAKDVMEKKLDNLKGSFKILRASLETFFITVGEGFQGPIKSLADGLRKITNWFVALPAPVKEAFGWFLLITGIVFTAGGIFALFVGQLVKMYRAFKDLQKGIQLLNAAFTAFAGEGLAAVAIPIAIIVAALIALAVIVYIFYTKWDQVWGWIKDNPYIAAIIAYLLLIIAPIVLIGFVIALLLKKWKVIWHKIEDIAGSVWDWLKQAASDVKDWLVQAWNDILQAARDIWQWIVDAVNKAANFFAELPGKILGFLESLPGLLAYIIGYAIGAMISIIVLGILQILDWFSQLPGWIWSAVSTLAGLLFQAGSDALSWLLRAVVAGSMQILEWMIALPGLIISAIADLATWLFNIGVSAITGLFNGLVSLVGTVLGWAADFPQKIADAFLDMAGWLFNIGKSAIEGLWNGLKDLAKSVIGWASDFAGGIADAVGDFLDIGSPSRLFHHYGELVMEGFQNGLEVGAKGVLRQILDTASDIQAAGVAMNITPAATTNVGAVPALTPAGVGPTASVPVQNIDESFTYNNYANEVDATEVVGEFYWQKLTGAGRRASVG